MDLEKELEQPDELQQVENGISNLSNQNVTKDTSGIEGMNNTSSIEETVNTLNTENSVNTLCVEKPTDKSSSTGEANISNMENVIDASKVENTPEVKNPTEPEVQNKINASKVENLIITSNIKPKDAKQFQDDSIENELNALINCEELQLPTQLDETKAGSKIKNDEDVAIKEVCRLCAQPKKGNDVFVYTNEELKEKIKFTLPIPIELVNGLPEYICRNCEMNLNLFYSFVKQIAKADKVIKEKIIQIDIKSGDADATIKEIFGADISELEGTKKKEANKQDKCSTLKESESKPIEKTIAAVKTYSKHSYDDEVKKRKVPKISNSPLIQQSNTYNFKCHRCEEYFIDYINVVDHNKKIHKQIEYPCPDCNKIFTSEKTLCQHIKDNHDVPVVCHICGKIFIHSNALEKHQINVHNFKLCDTCGVLFRLATQYKTHSLLHNNLEEYQCVFCYKKFGIHQKLLKHTKQSHADYVNIFVDKV